MTLVQNTRQARWLQEPGSFNKGSAIQSYTQIVTQISKLRNQFFQKSNFVQANGLPSVNEIRKGLADDEVYITYFPMFSGFGRLCVSPQTEAYSFDKLEPDFSKHVRLIEFATTASYAANDQLDSQFPFESALFLEKMLFAGLEKCMRPGSHVVLSLPTDFAGVPVGALLKEPPGRLGDGYDLKSAHWLIKDYSFSFVISARQFIALHAQKRTSKARFEYLGIGDPDLSKQDSSSPAIAKDLTALPDTAEEIKKVAAVFDPTRKEILLGQSATEENFRKQSISDYDVIHFATHGVFAQESGALLGSALILTPVAQSDQFNDGVLSSEDISRFSLQARLVVLSVCNSGRYDQKQSSLGIHDFQSAFSAAGTPTILATLWAIDSTTSTNIIVDFFKLWRAGGSGGAARALAQSVRGFLERSDRAHQHPRFWAPFVIFGDGEVHGASHQEKETPRAAFGSLEGFVSGGDVVSTATAGSDAILSIMGDWDGQRWAGFISSRTSLGKEKWRAVSREISAGPVAATDKFIYAVGMKGRDHFVPVIQIFDLEGRQIWAHEFEDLSYYSFSAVAADDDGAYVVALPLFAQTAKTGRAFPLKIDAAGDGFQKQAFAVPKSEFGNLGPSASVLRIGKRLVVTVNKTAEVKLDFARRTILGWPSSCFNNALANIYQFNISNLAQTDVFVMSNFKINALTKMQSKLLLAGEMFDGCSQKGTAAIMKFDFGKKAEPLWQDGDVFPSAVKRLAVEGERLFAIVNYERASGIDIMEDIKTLQAAFNDKRFLDRNLATVREASLLTFSLDGKLQNKFDYSAGLSVVLSDIRVIDGKVLVFGSLGGEPASSLH